jgi:hypothetical protein
MQLDSLEGGAAKSAKLVVHARLTKSKEEEKFPFPTTHLRAMLVGVPSYSSSLDTEPSLQQPSSPFDGRTLEAAATLVVKDPLLWGPAHPHLYTLRLLHIAANGDTLDTYEQKVGLRVVEVRGDSLLLNGQKMEMRGFGRHEDFPLLGRSDNPAVLVRDHACLRWIGANSYRTAHYPYSENDLDLADEMGMLVVSESPCVGLSFVDTSDVIARRQAQAKQSLTELVLRDCNRTCVGMIFIVGSINRHKCMCVCVCGYIPLPIL